MIENNRSSCSGLNSSGYPVVVSDPVTNPVNLIRLKTLSAETKIQINNSKDLHAFYSKFLCRSLYCTQLFNVFLFIIHQAKPCMTALTSWASPQWKPRKLHLTLQSSLHKLIKLIKNNLWAGLCFYGRAEMINKYIFKWLQNLTLIKCFLYRSWKEMPHWYNFLRWGYFASLLIFLGLVQCTCRRKKKEGNQVLRKKCRIVKT